jgi:hypothetical protein
VICKSRLCSSSSSTATVDHESLRENCTVVRILAMRHPTSKVCR